MGITNLLNASVNINNIQYVYSEDSLIRARLFPVDISG